MANGQTRPSHGCGSFGLTDTRRWRSGATWVSTRTPSSARRTASICRDGRRRSARSGKPKRPRRPPVSKEIAMPDAAQCAAHGAHRAIETEAKQPRASPQCRHLRARPPGALRQAYCQRARRTDGVHQNDAIAITAGRLSVAIECARPPELNQWERQFLGTRANWKGGRITQKQPDCLWRVSQRLGLRIRSRQTPPEQAAGLLNFEETPRRRPGGGRDQGGPG